MSKPKINSPATASSPLNGSPSSEPPGTLQIGEPHPASRDALKYICALGIMRQAALMESFASCAISGNRFAEVCGETLRRVMRAEPVSDRYVLGLAWAVRGMDSDAVVHSSV